MRCYGRVIVDAPVLTSVDRGNVSEASFSPLAMAPRCLSASSAEVLLAVGGSMGSMAAMASAVSGLEDALGLYAGHPRIAGRCGCQL